MEAEKPGVGEMQSWKAAPKPLVKALVLFVLILHGGKCPTENLIATVGKLTSVSVIVTCNRINITRNNNKEQ